MHLIFIVWRTEQDCPKLREFLIAAVACWSYRHSYFFVKNTSL